MNEFLYGGYVFRKVMAELVHHVAKGPRRLSVSTCYIYISHARTRGMHHPRVRAGITGDARSPERGTTFVANSISASR